MNASTALTHEARSAIPRGNRPVAFLDRDALSSTAAPRQRRSRNPGAAPSGRAGNAVVALRPSQVPIEGRQASRMPYGLFAVSGEVPGAAFHEKLASERSDDRLEAAPIRQLPVSLMRVHSMEGASRQPMLSVSTGPVLVQRCGGHACPPGGCHRDSDTWVAPSRASPGRSALDPASVREVVADSGAPLPPSVRANAEHRFGHSFGAVRIHTDSGAAESAAAIQARAYTVGSHIAFAVGEYRPETGAGRQLLAHELTHVVQQTGAAPSSAQPPSSLRAGPATETSCGRIVLSDPGDAFENEANSIAEEMLHDPAPFAASAQAIAGYPPARAVPRAFKPSEHWAVAMQRRARDPATAAPLVQRSPEGSPEHDVIQRQANIPGASMSAEATPPAGGTDVFFCSKNVALGRKHAFFRVGGAGPGNPTYELEHDNFGDHCPGGIQGIPWKDYAEDKDSTDATCVPAPAISAKCLAEKYDAYPHGYYCAKGPNSNTYARVTAEACGGTGLKPPGNLPGWADSPPVAGTANPTKNVHFDVLWCDAPITCSAPVPPAPVPPAPVPPAPASTTHTVVPGDYLFKIANDLCGDPSKWKDIYDANTDQISDPNLIFPGQVLTIPCAVSTGPVDGGG